MAKAKKAAKAKKPPPKKPAKSKTKSPAKPAGKVKKKAKKPVPAYATPEALRVYDFETQKQTSAMEVDVEMLETKWVQLKEKTSDAKKMFEGRLAEMREWVRERSDARGKAPKTLFAEADQQAAQREMNREYDKTGAAAANASAKAEPKNKGKGGAKALPFETTKEPDPNAWFPDDLWKKFPLDRFTIYGMTEADVKKIKDGETKRNIPNVGPLVTVGDLSRFTAPPSAGSTWNRTYADLKGIGPAAVDRLTQAETMFWSAWRKGLAEEFAAEMGFKKPLKVHTPEAGDGDESAGGIKKKGARKRKGKKSDGEGATPLTETLGDVLDDASRKKAEHDAAVEAGEKFEDEE